MELHFIFADSKYQTLVDSQRSRLNRKRALFVLTKIDEILTWEKQREVERDTRFVELGGYLCEARGLDSTAAGRRRAGQENATSTIIN